MADGPWTQYQAPQAEGPWTAYQGGGEAAGAKEPTEDSYRARVERTGEAFEKATGGGLAGVGKTAVAAGEIGLGMLSGVAGDVAGAATSLVTQDPKKGERVRKAIATEPATEAGKRGQEYVGALLDPVSKIFAKPPTYLEQHGHPIAAQAVRAVEDVAPLKVGEVGRAASKAVRPLAERVARAGEVSTAVRAAEEAPKQAAIGQARELGIKLPPSEAGGAVGKVLEGAAGKIRTEQEMSRANAKVINRKAGEAIGLSRTQSATPANIGRLKAKAIAVYDRVRTSGRIDLRPETANGKAYAQELEGVRNRTGQEALDFPEDTNDLIEKEIKKFSVPSADAGSMLAKIKGLREKAARAMASDDPDQFELGLARKKIATAMENAIDRQLQTESLGPGVKGADPNLIKDFRAAREQLAKIYNVEEALSPHGNVSAAVLARQLKRGVPLSGDLKKIAETYMEFPKVMRYVDSLGGHAPFSALDYLVGGVEAVAHPHRAGAIVGALALRPLARGIVKSGAYQRAAIKPREVRPGAVTRAARRLARTPTLQDRPGYTPPVKVEDQRDQQ